MKSRFWVIRGRYLALLGAALASAAIFAAVNAPPAVSALAVFNHFRRGVGRGQYAKDSGRSGRVRRQGDLFRRQRVGGAVS